MVSTQANLTLASIIVRNKFCYAYRSLLYIYSCP